MRKYYWTRKIQVVNEHTGKPRKDLAKFHNTYRGLYSTKKELVEGFKDGFFTHCLGRENADVYGDGTEWYEVPIKVCVKEN